MKTTMQAVAKLPDIKKPVVTDKQRLDALDKDFEGLMADYVKLKKEKEAVDNQVKTLSTEIAKLRIVVSKLNLQLFGL